MAVLTMLLAAGLLGGAQEGGKKAAAAESGPYGLPLLAAVKEKCKATADQGPVLEEIYKNGAQTEEDTKRRAKELQTDRKDLEKYLAQGRIDVINKVLALLEDEQDKAFNELVAAAPPAKKKKK